MVKYSSAYVGNSCKESTSHPNIRQYTDTRCQSVPRVRGGAARLSRTDWRLGFIHHPRRDAISAIFTRKASRDVPAARSSNKAPAILRRTCARLSRVGAVARISSTFSPPFMCRRTRLGLVPRDPLSRTPSYDPGDTLQANPSDDPLISPRSHVDRTSVARVSLASAGASKLFPKGDSRT